MATRGVTQCLQLTLYYCEHGGSSEAVRRYLASGALTEFCTQRPQTKVHVRVRNGHHPFVKADYATRATKGFANKPNAPVIHQISLKSKYPHVTTSVGRTIDDVLQQLANKSGRKTTKFTQPVYSQTPSVQGVWTPSLDLHRQPKFQMTVVDAAAAGTATTTSSS